MRQTSSVLFALAEQFEAQQAYAQAVKCLTPICSQSSGELPSVVALARLRLATLLLAHFNNCPEAKSLLLTAVSAPRHCLLLQQAAPPPSHAARAQPGLVPAAGARAAADAGQLLAQVRGVGCAGPLQPPAGRHGG